MSDYVWTPDPEGCPFDWYVEAQLGWHDHDRCQTVALIQSLGRESSELDEEQRHDA